MVKVVNLASTLCTYNLRKGDLFVLSLTRVRRVRRESLSLALLMCDGGVRSVTFIEVTFMLGCPHSCIIGHHIILPLVQPIGVSYMCVCTILQMTQATRVGAVTVVWKTPCKLCRPLPPTSMGSRLPFFGQADHADPLDSWQCF